MKVFNLCCGQQHLFEGWFASEDDFQSQLARGLLSCPMCADIHIQKRPSAPRLNLKGGTEGGGDDSPPVEPISMEQQQAALMRALRTVVAQTEDVGDLFADQARAMHQGELTPKAIRGHTTVDQARELLDEGVPILPLPLLPGVKEPLH
ncbi:DUF1178 family protein [Hydrogenophaga soli]|nr:DUF1178 family protein [Burkholderiaceae bacterium]